MTKDRDIIIDSSIYGMGRGAGNLNTELLADYLNKKYICICGTFKKALAEDDTVTWKKLKDLIHLILVVL